MFDKISKARLSFLHFKINKIIENINVVEIIYLEKKIIDFPSCAGVCPPVFVTSPAGRRCVLNYLLLYKR